jgi:hypothetical protein
MMDLTKLTHAQLRLLVGKRGMPGSWGEIYDLQQAQHQEAAEAARRHDAEIAAAQEEADRLASETQRQQALSNLEKFDSALDQLLGLSTPAVPDHGFAAVNGPEVAALLLMTKSWLDGQLEQVRTGLREQLAPLAAEFNWNLDYLVRRFMAGKSSAVVGEVAWSQGVGLTLGRGLARTEAEASDLMVKGAALGYKAKAVIRSRSRTGKTGKARKRGKKERD